MTAKARRRPPEWYWRDGIDGPVLRQVTLKEAWEVRRLFKVGAKYGLHKPGMKL